MESMDTRNRLWSNWCLLCAKENAQNEVNINFESKPLAMGININLSLREALERFFLIQIPSEEIFPKHLCTDCYALLVSIMRFSGRVQLVQQMYMHLMRTTLSDACDLKAIRLQFDVFDDCRQRWYPHMLPTEAAVTSQINSIDPLEKDIVIKEESCGVVEMVYDEDCLADYRLADDEEPFEYNDDQRSESFTEEGTTNETLKEINTSLETDSTVKRCKKKKIRRKIEDVGSKKKEYTMKDFYLDTQCRECGKKFSLYSTYCEHIKVDHANESTNKRWKCPSCDRVVQNWYNFERHMRTHMPVEDRLTLKCPECDNHYLSNAQLETHLKQKHSSEKAFICEECGLGVKTLSNLKQHMVTHSDATPFECEKCKKTFKSVLRLRRHLNTHGPDKHVCTVCSLELNSRTTLKRHLLVHSDEMQHKCGYCGRAFKRSKTLKNHLLLHTGLKPYSCSFCDRTFADGSNYRNHMKKKHPKELAELEASGNKTRTQKPKLENLKALTETAENLTPVAIKSSGCYAVG